MNGASLVVDRFAYSLLPAAARVLHIISFRHARLFESAACGLIAGLLTPSVVAVKREASGRIVIDGGS